jgi:hypothetical protein
MAFSRRSQGEATTNPTQQSAESKMSITDSGSSELRASPPDITYWSIFRFATIQDLMGLIISSGFAIAGGAILPTLTVSIILRSRNWDSAYVSPFRFSSEALPTHFEMLALENFRFRPPSTT